MITNLSILMQNLQAKGMDYEHIRNLLQETLLRYDDRIDSNLFIPNIEKQADDSKDLDIGINLFTGAQQRHVHSSNLFKGEKQND
jgi:hypothetical protein